jgi:hypothetical protein
LLNPTTNIHSHKSQNKNKNKKKLFLFMSLLDIISWHVKYTFITLKFFLLTIKHLIFLFTSTDFQFKIYFIANFFCLHRKVTRESLFSSPHFIWSVVEQVILPMVASRPNGTLGKIPNCQHLTTQK